MGFSPFGLQSQQLPRGPTTHQRRRERFRQTQPVLYSRFMVQGFWIVQFEGVAGNGGGVVMFLNGQVYGGDSGFVYTGKYHTDETQITARVLVRNFLPEIPSVFGIPGDYELDVKGTVADKTIKGTASLVAQAAVGIVVKLTKVGELPA